MGTDLSAHARKHYRVRVTSGQWCPKGLRQCSPPKVPPTPQSPGRRIRSSEKPLQTQTENPAQPAWLGNSLPQAPPRQPADHTLCLTFPT